MGFNLKNRHFLELDDFTPQELSFLLQLATELKAAKHVGNELPRLQGKNIALIFKKIRHAHVSPLRLPPTIREPMSPTSVPQAHISVRRN